MNNVKVTVKTETGHSWSGYFSDVPILKRLRTEVENSIRPPSCSGKVILEVLYAAEELLLFDSPSQSRCDGAVGIWITSVKVAGVHIGTVKYESFPVTQLKGREEKCVKH